MCTIDGSTCCTLNVFHWNNEVQVEIRVPKEVKVELTTIPEQIRD